MRYSKIINELDGGKTIVQLVSITYIRVDFDKYYVRMSSCYIPV